MAYYPINFIPFQFENVSGLPASGYVLKAYDALSPSSSIAMAIDSSGAPTVASITLNSMGYPSVSGNVVIPYVDRDYNLSLYPSKVAADSNTGAIWTVTDKSPITISNLDNAALQGNATAENITVSGTARFNADVIIIDSINDVNNNELIKFGTTLAAVNEISVTNAATANGPVIAASGGDTNIDLNVNAKGTGTVKVNNQVAVGAPTGSASAGDVNIAGQYKVNGTALAITWGAITGFLPSSIAGNSTTASLTVSAGQAANSTNALYISKATTTSWLVSNGNAINGYEGGSTLPNSSTIHFFICAGTTGTGTFASTSLTPTFPSGYNTYSRRIFSLNTTGAGALIPVTSNEIYGGAVLNYLVTQLSDVAVTNLGTSRSLYTLTVPGGIKVQVLYRASSDSNVTILLTSGDETDIGPSGNTNTFPMYDQFPNSGTSPNGTPRDGILTTNTSRQIGARAFTGASNGFYLTNRGFIDFRRS